MNKPANKAINKPALNKTVLIVGSTGVLGKQLIPRLNAKGFTVRGLVRPESKAKVDAIEDSFDVAYGNVMDKDSLLKATTGVDYVISCVSAGTDRTAKSRGNAENIGQLNLMEACKTNGVKQFVFTSTLFPKNSLGYSFVWAKLSTEEQIRDFGLTYTIFRPCGFFYELFYRGEPFVENLRGYFPILGDGTTSTQMLAEQDLADMYVASLGNEECFNKTLEVGGGSQMTFNGLMDQWSKVRMKVEGKPVLPLHIPLTPTRLMAEVAKPFYEQMWGLVQLLDFSYDNMSCDMTEPKRILGIKKMMTLEEYITIAYEKKYAGRKTPMEERAATKKLVLWKDIFEIEY
jgi:uncharacterized protein YbjT (DUF2867 family)